MVIPMTGNLVVRVEHQTDFGPTLRIEFTDTDGILLAEVASVVVPVGASVEVKGVTLSIRICGAGEFEYDLVPRRGSPPR